MRLNPNNSLSSSGNQNWLTSLLKWQSLTVRSPITLFNCSIPADFHLNNMMCNLMLLVECWDKQQNKMNFNTWGWKAIITLDMNWITLVNMNFWRWSVMISLNVNGNTHPAYTTERCSFLFNRSLRSKHSLIIVCETIIVVYVLKNLWFIGCPSHYLKLESAIMRLPKTFSWQIKAAVNLKAQQYRSINSQSATQRSALPLVTALPFACDE